MGKVGELSGRAGQRGSRQDSSCTHWCRAGEGWRRREVQGSRKVAPIRPLDHLHSLSERDDFSHQLPLGTIHVNTSVYTAPASATSRHQQLLKRSIPSPSNSSTSTTTSSIPGLKVRRRMETVSIKNP